MITAMKMNIFYTQRWPLHTIANVVLPPPGKLFGNWVESRGWLGPNTSYNPYDLRNFLARPEEFFVETLSTSVMIQHSPKVEHQATLALKWI
jgi:hypothetical protein